MTDNNKVTIDADYFYELFRKANETDNICKECREEHTAEEFNAIAKERDDLKSTISRMEKSVEQMRKKDLRELEAVRKERDELKAKLDAKYGVRYGGNVFLMNNEHARKAIKIVSDELDAAVRCIGEAFDAWTKEDGTDASYNRIGEILRAYREKNEEAR